MKIGIIADDLTGANASGVRLSKQGFRAMTVLHSAAFPEEEPYDAIVMDTDSRYMDETIAKHRVQSAIGELDNWGAAVLSKRIDSTLRGNVGTEIDTILEVKDGAVAVLAPSFPDSSRIVSGGYMLVENEALESTDAARDPVKPITQSWVPGILENQSSYKVDSIPLQDILSSSAHVAEMLRTKIQNGSRIICCDAVSNKDLETIARAMSSIDTPFLFPVDPGPLTAEYVKQRFAQKTFAIQAPVLALVGSATALTGGQLEYVMKKMEADVIYVDAEKLASYTGTWVEEVDHTAAKAKKQLLTSEILIITTHKPGFGLIDLKKQSQKEGYSEDALAKRIADGLGNIFRKVMQENDLPKTACFSSGGDVTASICAFARANGIELIDEVLPLTAYGQLTGGYFHGLPIITKGGMVGEETAMYESLKFLQTTLAKQGGNKNARESGNCCTNGGSGRHRTGNNSESTESAGGV
ncbi:four-carbon acid sugar kinase family protein [Salibacterium aidingense]|uniref:four-carbon acid sugar kinase family protein n=1 Tax=Salibacterium aidingense TaxID=384933 RepID=UPI0003FFB4C4|nr:four-carbon acid sugar kinase family protein [Salibacterium aidingense]